MSSSSVHVGCSKSKLNGLGQTDSSLMASVASLDSTIGLRLMPELLGLDAPVPVAVDAGSEGEVTCTDARKLQDSNPSPNIRETNEKPSANYFRDSSSGNNDPLSFLPSGFLERTKGQGFVVSHWAPQVEVLGHRATGGFLTHCGWFSTVESIVHGVAIIAWPLFSEQRMIAAILADGMRVRPKVDDESGVVEKDEVANAVKSLMGENEGREIHERMRVLKDEAAAAIKQDGSSTINP
ncbi:hypothetical protein HN51_046612 [Arachis hypogaea]